MIAEDMIAYMESVGLGRRHETLFTPADQGAYDGRPLVMVAEESRSSAGPDVTADVDRATVTLTFAGVYGQVGEKEVYELAFKTYMRFRLLLHETINGTEYLCIQAAHPPSHDGLADGRTIYSVTLEVYRALAEVE